MKLKTVILTISIVATGFLFTGCSNKQAGIALEMNTDKDKCEVFFKRHSRDISICEIGAKENLINIDGIGAYSMATISNYNNSTAAGLQVAAEVTLRRNHNYFAIAHPKSISSFNGALVNTAEEYFKQCETNLARSLVFNLDPCGIHYSPRVANMTIVTYKEQPNDVLTFNANDVLNYLHKEKRFDQESSLGIYKIMN